MGDLAGDGSVLPSRADTLRLLPLNMTFVHDPTIESQQAELLLLYEGIGLVTAAVLGAANEEKEEDACNDTGGGAPDFDTVCALRPFGLALNARS
ncbi:MAG: hypothetical protein AAF280_02640 [Pseudomonadota bacterium]